MQIETFKTLPDRKNNRVRWDDVVSHACQNSGAWVSPKKQFATKNSAYTTAHYVKTHFAVDVEVRDRRIYVRCF